VFNDPAQFAEESLEGFAALHASLVRPVHGGVVRRNRVRDGKVAVVIGGGSGHYPMFAGLVGEGLADGAVVGNIFTSPSAQFAYSVARQADRGGGVVFCYGNYAGDVMHFGIATERLRGEGIETENLVVHDDVLSAPATERERRRGLAGDFVVTRALAGAAARGLPMRDVVAAGEAANDRTRTVGVAFAGCTFPGADHPLFEVPAGRMAIGMGAHGEPGLELIDAVPSEALARILFDHVVTDVPHAAGDRVAVIVNGLGATKGEELFVLWRDLMPLFAEKGWTIVEPEVGEIITSLDMSGLSLTVTWLDEDLEAFWTAPAYAPGYRKGSVLPGRTVSAYAQNELPDTEAEIPEATSASRSAATVAVGLLEAALTDIRAAEEQLADADSVAGDGDHGRGMVRGLEAATQAGRLAVQHGAGIGTTLALAGDAWGEQAGGTSGALWGTALRAFSGALGDVHRPDSAALSDAASRFRDAVQRLGRVEVGDKTMLDAIGPATEAFRAAAAAGESTAKALRRAARAAEAAAQETACLRPRVGRARPLAERSLGHPDPGCLSFSIILQSIVRATEDGDE
jgi:dihydroxyacetone kinase